jgi:serine/threonine protein kinase
LGESGAHGEAYEVCHGSNCNFVLKRILFNKFDSEQEEDEETMDEHQMDYFTRIFKQEVALQNKASITDVCSPVYLAYIIKHKELGLIMDKYEMTLKELFSQKKLSLSEQERILSDTYSALETLLCESNIVHNDSQLSNFMVNKENEVKIIDFGQSFETKKLDLRDFDQIKSDINITISTHKRN